MDTHAQSHIRFLTLSISTFLVIWVWNEIGNNSKRKINFFQMNQAFCLSHIVWNIVYFKLFKSREFSSMSSFFAVPVLFVFLLFSFILLLFLTWCKTINETTNICKYKAHFTHNYFLFGTRWVKALHSKLEGYPVKSG